MKNNKTSFIWATLLLVLMPNFVIGQRLFDDSNSSPLSIGNTASCADIDINAMVNNPAGIVFSERFNGCDGCGGSSAVD